jgi:ubiquinone/menaquinone biosynthesis C-methylase UbiE
MGDEYRAVRAAFGAAAGAKGTDVALGVATGAGHTALALAAVVKRVVAFDITPEMLAETERNAAGRG